MDASARDALRAMGWRYYESPAQKRPRFERIEYPPGDRRAARTRRHWFIREKMGRWVLQSRFEYRDGQRWTQHAIDYVKTFDTPTAAATFFALHHGR